MRKITEEEKVDEKVEWIIECRRETDRQTLTQKEDESGTEVWTWKKVTPGKSWATGRMHKGLLISVTSKINIAGWEEGNLRMWDSLERSWLNVAKMERRWSSELSKNTFHLQKLKEQVKLYEVEVLAIAIKVDYNQCSLLYRHLIETVFTSFSFTTGTC